VGRTGVFATSHAWGSDMAVVVGSFLGDRFRAALPLAGQPAIWTIFGLSDDHFAAASPYAHPASSRRLLAH
jgi:hypothetical protein